jgi:hypothetical protein
MLPIFTYPLALWGLLAVPALVAIYWFRNRYHRHPVSSLMLWQEPQLSRTGGTRLDRLRTPLLFFLELLALTLLALAASDPQVPLARGRRPLIVVLDDSFSMLAGTENSPRSQAVQALERELHRRPRPSVRLLLAGDHVQFLGETAHTTEDALDQLREWRCLAPAGRIEEALSLANEVGGELPVLLVLTDHAPPAELTRGRIQWWAFGEPRSNVAFVNAARTHHETGERCLLEVVNFSEEERSTPLLIETGTPATLLQQSTLRLAPRQTHRLILQLPEDTAALHARLGADNLAIDNEVNLLPVAHKPVRTAFKVSDEALRQQLDKALRATRHTLLVTERPELLFTDQPEPPAPGDNTWVVRIMADKNAEAYTGPFVLDRNHPLTEGLSLSGVVWGAGASEHASGTPIILAGDVPLLTETEDREGRRELRLHLRPDLSTLADAPAWPILLWNIVQWRASFAPGVIRPNVRLGEQAVVTFAEPHESVSVVYPDHSRHLLPVADRRLVLPVEQAGLYTIQTTADPVQIASNALTTGESDLTGCATGRWGDWLNETSLRLEYQSVGWALLLLVLGVATLHLLLVARQRRRMNW